MVALGVRTLLGIVPTPPLDELSGFSESLARRLSFAILEVRTTALRSDPLLLSLAAA
jgi:hypothetical protein